MEEWKTRGHDRPADSPHRLTAAGFEPEATETVLIGLAEDLAARVPSPPEGFVVRQVSDDADMHRIAAMESEVWNEDWSWLAADLIARTRGGGITVLVVEAGGRIVSAAWLVFNAGTEFAGLWGGSTLASWRGRGLYRALVARRAALAVAQGVRYLQVDASDDSRDPRTARLHRRHNHYPLCLDAAKMKSEFPGIRIRAPWSTGDDGYRPAGSSHERAHVTGIAGQDPVSRGCHGYDTRVDSIGRTGLPEQYACLSTQVVVDGFDVDGLEQPGKVHLSPGRVAPHLSDHDARTAEFESRVLGHPQARHHRPVPTIHRHKSTGVKHEGAHAAGFVVPGDGRASSAAALASSSAVSDPCSVSQASRNSARASARSLAAAASASQRDRPLPCWRAAARTASPSSGSNETLSLSTFTHKSYHGTTDHGRED